ncbi:immunity 49 family protein [Lentzea guizhouensis]|uniref:immunity 49 family protein n=1 Tax=Lentzea guizhouensis TaxID=1586287 RepID=UPI0014763414|nr:immunity 49 family protein [Lentzea guizhouensis]
MQRHPTDAEWAEEQLEYYVTVVPEGAASVEQSTERLSVLHPAAIDRLGYASVLDPTAQNLTTWDAVVQAMQVTTGIYAAAGATEGTVEWLIGERTVQIPATGPVHYANFKRWLDAFWLAAIVRDKKCLDLLASFPLDIIKASGNQYEELDALWARALQMFANSEPGMAEALAEAMAATDPERLRVSAPEYALRLAFPAMNTFLNLMRSNHEREFNEALAQALEQHKAYYTADSKLADDPRGLVALAPLGLACIAKDSGLNVDVESDYLPKHLLLGSWVGEYRTS